MREGKVAVMRKAKREIKEFADIVAVMRRCDVCRLGIVDDDGVPYVVPLNFGLEAAEGKVTLYFHSALEGHKLDLLAKNPRVGFEMDCDHKLQYFSEKCYCTMAYASVMGKGTVRMIEESDEVLHALDVLMGQYHLDDGATYNPATVSRTRVYALDVIELTGKQKLPK